MKCAWCHNKYEAGRYTEHGEYCKHCFGPLIKKKEPFPRTKTMTQSWQPEGYGIYIGSGGSGGSGGAYCQSPGGAGGGGGTGYTAGMYATRSNYETAR